MGYKVTNIMRYHEHIPPENFTNEMIGRLFPEEAYNLGMKVTGPRNEIIFISCTNFRAIEIIQRLEDTTEKPVISSNQVTMWHAIRTLGIKDHLTGYGCLFNIA